MTDVIDKLIDEIERSYTELTGQLSDPELLADRGRYAVAARRHAGLAEAHALALQYREAERAAAEAEEMLAADAEPDADAGSDTAAGSGDGRRDVRGGWRLQPRQRRLGANLHGPPVRRRVPTRQPVPGNDGLRVGAVPVAAATRARRPTRAPRCR